MMWITFLREKAKIFEKFNIFKDKVENESGLKIKCLKLDRGREFTSNENNIFYNDRGIKKKTSAPRTPPQNGIDERINRSIMDYARTLMMEKNVAKKY